MINTQTKAFYKYRTQRENHWDGLAPSYCHNALKAGYHRRLLEIYRFIVPAGLSVLEVGCGKGDLLAALEPLRGVGIDFSREMLSHATKLHPALEFIYADAHDLEELKGPFDVIIFSDLLNDLWDVQRFLEQVRTLCNPSTRVVCNFYSHLWALPLRLAQNARLATPMLPQNWLTVSDVCGLLHLTGFEMISHRTDILFPLHIPVIAPLCNRFLSKVLPSSLFAMTHVVVAAPAFPPKIEDPLPTVSIIVPARNEAGNIASLLRRIPQMGGGVEVIFVEGGSSDGTFEAIEKEIFLHPQLNCRLIRQAGIGKGDAVRSGFEQASGEILIILDADMTVAPEDLTKFYQALANYRGEFINGVRLVYPMHEKAMRFFNLIGNKFFSLAFTWLLGQTVKDTLCGTKALWNKDYKKLAAQRTYFGTLDPFGDFDLLFGAARLNLKIVDLPVRYSDRTYGATNINCWSHGWLLLRMVIIAARKLKFI